MDHHTEEHVHESPMVMIGPLMVLGSAVARRRIHRLSAGPWLAPSISWHRSAGASGEHDVSTGLVLSLMMIASGIALFGWGLGPLSVQRESDRPGPMGGEGRGSLYRRS